MTAYPTMLGGARMCYDTDGSAVIAVPPSTAGGRAFDVTDKPRANGDDPSVRGFDSIPGPFGASNSIPAVIFPERRVLTGWFLHETGTGTEESSGHSADLQGSNDTVNGQDGAWTSIGSMTPYRYGVFSQTGRHRLSIAAVASSSAWKAVRCVGAASTACLHLYGSPGAGVNRPALWHPTADIPLPGSSTDFGSTPRVSAADLVFRVKNLSATHSMTGVTLTLSPPTYARSSPEMTLQWLLADRLLRKFTATLPIEGLGPGQISLPYYLRRVTPTNAQLGVWTGRVNVVVGAWEVA